MSQSTRSNREHSFDWELATIVGLEKAILLKNISYWCDENRRRGVSECFDGGIWWTSESLRSLAFKYPYFKKPSISRWMNELHAAGWIRMTGQIGGQNRYAPGEIFHQWDAGYDVRPTLSQNETPPVGVSQNETGGVSKRDTGGLKMRHMNIDILSTISLNADSSKKQPNSKTEPENAPPVPAPPPVLFSESGWPEKGLDAWRLDMLAQGFPEIVDTDHYYRRCQSWSKKNSRTAKDWIAFATGIATDDSNQGKLKLKTVNQHANNVGNPAPSNSTPNRKAFDKDRTLARAARILGKTG
jgi:hypothetical protein